MSRWLSIAILVGIGAAWGTTLPLTKVAVSTGYQHFGLLFWQMLFIAVFMAGFQFLRGRLVNYEKKHLPIILIVALFGTLLPGTVTYVSYTYLPAGLVAVIISTVPLFALSFALILGLDTVKIRRVLGLLVGLVGIIILVGPSEGLPVGVTIGAVLFTFLAPFFWSIEDISIAKLGLGGLGSNQILLAASVIGLVIVTPLTIATGQFVNLWKPWTYVEYALLGSMFLHMVAYTSFIWFIGVAGPVMASQVAYLVTGFGLAGSVIFLGEDYSPYFWISALLLMIGLFLVAPRKGEGHN